MVAVPDPESRPLTAPSLPGEEPLVDLDAFEAAGRALVAAVPENEDSASSSR